MGKRRNDVRGRDLKKGKKVILKRGQKKRGMADQDRCQGKSIKIDERGKAGSKVRSWSGHEKPKKE